MVTVKDIKIVLYHDGDLQHYHPGADVKGAVVVTLVEPKECKKLSVKLVGEADVRWTERHGTGEDRTKETYSNSVENTFPFIFKLPDNAAPSFKDQHGKVEYEIKAKLTESGFEKNKHKAKKVHVIVRENGAELMRSYMEPATFDKDTRVQLLCFNFGSMSMSCTLPRTGFSPGEAIPINVHVENQSTKTFHIHASLSRKDTFKAKGVRQKYVKNELTSIDSAPIQPEETTEFEGKSLQISHDVPSTMKSCSCISVEYDLVINADVPWAPDVTIKIPLAIYVK